MKQGSQKWKVPPKLSLDQGLDISFAGVFCQFRSIVIVLVLSLVACSTLSEVVVPPTFDIAVIQARAGVITTRTDFNRGASCTKVDRV